VTRRALAASDTPAPDQAVETALFADNDFRAVVFDERTAKLHHLNPVASAVWVLCDGTTSVAAVEAELADVLGMDASTAASHVDAAMRQFWDAGLLAGSPAPVVMPNDPAVPTLARPPDP